MPERDPFDDRLERQLVSAAEQLERQRSARRRDGIRARIAIGTSAALAALAALAVALVLVDGDDRPAPSPASAPEAGACAPFARAGRLRVERLEPPAAVVRAAPSLSPEMLASGVYRGGIDAEGVPRAVAAGAPAVCPAPLDVGAVYDPRVVSQHGAARGVAGVSLSALRGPALSGVAPARRAGGDDNGWKICLALQAGTRAAPAAIACEPPRRVVDDGLVALLRQPSGAPAVFVFYVVTDAHRLELRFADGHTDVTTLDAGVGSIQRREVGSDPARTPVSYRPIRGDGRPLGGGGTIDYGR